MVISQLCQVTCDRESTGNLRYALDIWDIGKSEQLMVLAIIALTCSRDTYFVHDE